MSDSSSAGSDCQGHVALRHEKVRHLLEHSCCTRLEDEPSALLLCLPLCTRPDLSLCCLGPGCGMLLSAGCACTREKAGDARRDRSLNTAHLPPQRARRDSFSWTGLSQQCRTGQGRTGQDCAGQDMTGHARSGLDPTGGIAYRLRQWWLLSGWMVGQLDGRLDGHAPRGEPLPLPSHAPRLAGRRHRPGGHVLRVVVPQPLAAAKPVDDGVFRIPADDLPSLLQRLEQLLCKTGAGQCGQVKTPKRASAPTTD
eukprot:1186549-Prorocentrum_minimum.AAC.4